MKPNHMTMLVVMMAKVLTGLVVRGPSKITQHATLRNPRELTEPPRRALCMIWSRGTKVAIPDGKQVSAVGQTII